MAKETKKRSQDEKRRRKTRSSMREGDARRKTEERIWPRKEGCIVE